MNWRFALERLKVLAEQVPECVRDYNTRGEDEERTTEERLAVSAFAEAARWLLKAAKE